MKKRWVVSPPAPEAHRIAAEFKLHPVIASILLRRGLKDPAEIFSFLNPSLDCLESPFAFKDMKKAVDRVLSAITRKEKIIVYGDYDVDGITGSAILAPVLKKMGADVETHIPHRVSEGYGLNAQTVEKLLSKKFKLLITVDNGITGVGPIGFLRQKGVDTIVVDHHKPKEEYPPAYAIVSSTHPQGGGDENLAACGLAWKLGWALLGSLERVREYLDLVAVGTIADVAPVVGDNRILLKHGLEVLAKTTKPGLRALMEVAKVSKTKPTCRDIAFGLGPRINASGRMGSPENSFKILTTDNALLAQNLAKILDEGNRDRQRVELAAFEEAVERVETEGFAQTHRALVLESPDWHEGVLGIVAARLVERYQKPSVVISLKEGVGKGSGRSVPGFSIFDAVLKSENLLLTFGGHAQACGLTIKKENIENFRGSLSQAVQELWPKEWEASLPIDGELSLKELDFDFLKSLERLAPFGPGNPKPFFVSRNLKFRGQPVKRGQDTLQGWVTDASGKITCEVVGFRAFNRWKSQEAKQALDLVYQPSLKEWNGISSVQLELEDWK
jgi:single-stranded-DNA-specific exonuclease